VSDLPLAERGQLLSSLAATLATLPAHRAQTWRLGEAMRQLLHADGVAITVEYLTDSRTTICASDEVADALESLQEITGEGPGYEAARTDAIVVAELDGRDDPRWPMLVHAVAESHGPLSVCAVPVHAGGYLSGVATLYTRSRRSLAELPERVAFLANAVGTALLADAADQSDGQPHLGDAWSSRSVIHQATGMVMAQVRLGPEDALALLRGHAYATGTEVNDVAAQVVGRSINFSDFAVEGE
jgi:hypothetical protein